MDSPFPTLQQDLLLKIGMTDIILLHTKELLGDTPASKKWHLGKYLALKHLKKREF